MTGSLYRHVSFEMATDAHGVAQIGVEFSRIHYARLAVCLYVLLSVAVAGFAGDTGMKKWFAAV